MQSEMIGKLANAFRIKPNGRKIGGFFLLAATAGIAASAVDDVLVFQQCSKEAVEKAAADQRIKEILGPIKRGWWNEATIGFSQQGHSVSCSFPVYGKKRSAEIRLKAIRQKGNHIWTYLCKSGHWELLSVEAYVYQLENGSRSLQCITLT